MKLEELARMLHAESCSCVIYNRGEVLMCHQRGVADLFRLLKTEPAWLQGALIADKVVGKGAAALMVVGRVSEVYADVISGPALELLKVSGVEVSCGECVENIINRWGTGICPVETLCMECETVEQCVERIEEFIANQKS